MTTNTSSSGSINTAPDNLSNGVSEDSLTPTGDTLVEFRRILRNRSSRRNGFRGSGLEVADDGF